MLRSLTSAVTGLKNFTIKLDIIGNNLANVRTLGYKGSRVTFAEARSQSLAGISRGFGGGFGNLKQIGLGVTVSTTDIDFNQGSLEYTGTPTDMAIQGGSFFVLNDGEKNRYTRAGNFFFNNQGVLVNPQGLAVQGWRANEVGNIDIFTPLQEILLDTNLSSPASQTENIFLTGNLDSTLAPVKNVFTSTFAFTRTSDGSAALETDLLTDLVQTAAIVAGDTIEITGTLPDGTAIPPGIEYTYAAGGRVADLVAAVEAAYGADATATFNSDGKIVLTDTAAGESLTTIALGSTAAISVPSFEVTTAGFTGVVSASTAVYDSLGEGHNMIFTFTQTETSGLWTWQADFIGAESIVSGETGTIQFNQAGEVAAFDVDGSATGVTVDPGNGAANFTVNINVQGGVGFSGVTQFASDPSIIVREQDGRPTGVLLRFAIDTNGVITGIFSNEKNITLAQIALAEFPNPVGLRRSGDGLYDLASSSGNPIIGKAGEQFSAQLISGSLETSNVDLVSQFTDMIVTQRGFQANARVITTADQILEETMRLKR